MPWSIFHLQARRYSFLFLPPPPSLSTTFLPPPSLLRNFSFLTTMDNLSFPSTLRSQSRIWNTEFRTRQLDNTTSSTPQFLSGAVKRLRSRRKGCWHVFHYNFTFLLHTTVTLLYHSSPSPIPRWIECQGTRSLSRSIPRSWRRVWRTPLSSLMVVGERTSLLVSYASWSEVSAAGNTVKSKDFNFIRNIVLLLQLRLQFRLTCTTTGGARERVAARVDHICIEGLGFKKGISPFLSSLSVCVNSYIVVVFTTPVKLSV